MTEYVLGFLFSEDKQRVALIKKNNPVWQRGLYNGIGGKIEDSETPYEAMVREFKEETGVKFTGWVEALNMFSNEIFTNTIFVGFSNKAISEVRTVTDESVIVVPVGSVLGVIPNLRWIMPLLLDTKLRLPGWSSRIQYD